MQHRRFKELLQNSIRKRPRGGHVDGRHTETQSRFGMNQSNRKARGQIPIRRSRDEGRRLVEVWRASGVRASSFCCQSDVTEHVLHYWPRRNSESGSRGAGVADFFVMSAEPSTGGGPQGFAGHRHRRAVALKGWWVGRDAQGGNG